MRTLLAKELSDALKTESVHDEGQVLAGHACVSTGRTCVRLSQRMSSQFLCKCLVATVIRRRLINLSEKENADSICA